MAGSRGLILPAPAEAANTTPPAPQAADADGGAGVAPDPICAATNSDPRLSCGSNSCCCCRGAGGPMRTAAAGGELHGRTCCCCCWCVVVPSTAPPSPPTAAVVPARRAPATAASCCVPTLQQSSPRQATGATLSASNRLMMVAAEHTATSYRESAAQAYTPPALLLTLFWASLPCILTERPLLPGQGSPQIPAWHNGGTTDSCCEPQAQHGRLTMNSTRLASRQRRVAR